MRSGRVGGFRPLARSTVIASSIAALMMALSPSGVLAATTVIGSPAGLYSCGGNYNLVQSTSPAGTSYGVSAAGVITSWSTQGGGYTTPLRLQVWRRTSSYMTFTLVATSPLATPVGTVVNTFTLAAPDRIAVQAGDLLGLRIEGASTDTALCVQPAPGGTYGFSGGAQPAVGATMAFVGQPASQLNVSATVESSTTPPQPPPPGPVPPPASNGCDSSTNGNMTDGCAQTLVLWILSTALRVSPTRG